MQYYWICCLKLSSCYTYKKYIYNRHQWVSYLDLGPIPKISHYVHANIPKFKKKSQVWPIWFQAFQMRDGHGADIRCTALLFVRGATAHVLLVPDLLPSVLTLPPPVPAAAKGSLHTQSSLAEGTSLAWLETPILSRAESFCSPCGHPSCSPTPCYCSGVARAARLRNEGYKVPRKESWTSLLLWRMALPAMKQPMKISRPISSCITTVNSMWYPS